MSFREGSVVIAYPSGTVPHMTAERAAITVFCLGVVATFATVLLHVNGWVSAIVALATIALTRLMLDVFG